VSDVRGQRLRLGFGIYQTQEEVDEFVRRMEEADASQPYAMAVVPTA
jgi:selenocysteine lyase/cysteine desulfurase